MAKRELIAKLAEHYPRLVAKDAEMAVAAILETMTTTLEKGGRVETRGFRSFSINYRPARSGMNLMTAETVQVPGKLVPHFKAGKELRQRVDNQAEAIAEVCLPAQPGIHTPSHDQALTFLLHSGR
jgi:integration host factor subunit beta